MYDAEMILGDYDFPGVGDTTDTQNDPFEFTAGYESINNIAFETDSFAGPVPALGARSLVVLATLLALVGATMSVSRRREAAARR
jgi:hypothetical protein